MRGSCGSGKCEVGCGAGENDCAIVVSGGCWRDMQKAR